MWKNGPSVLDLERRRRIYDALTDDFEKSTAIAERAGETRQQTVLHLTRLVETGEAEFRAQRYHNTYAKLQPFYRRKQRAS